MVVKKYEENGQTLWKVYVHARSSKNRNRRIQKYAKGFKTKAEAIKQETKLDRLARKELFKMDGLGLDWGDVVHLWWEEVKSGFIKKVSTRSAKGYLSIINKWTKIWFDRPAASITRADARTLIMKLEKANLSKSYQKKVKNTINCVFDWGIDYSHIIGLDHSPFKGVTIEVREEKAPDILSLEEIKRFLSAAKALDHHWYPIWSFAVLTGMRSGELHALLWEQIDLEKRTILVNKSYDANEKKVGPTKSRYWRTIPINESLYSLILDIKNKRSPNDGPFVLPRSKEWDNGDQASSLRAFLRSINMKEIKFHALRACFATQMLANGVPAPIVMKVGGWKKSSTMDIYLRLAGVDTKGATDCLEFVPDQISFADNVTELFGNSKELQ